MSQRLDERDQDASPPAVIVQQGKLLDFIDQTTQRNETPEEYVRQEIAKSLVREYGYPKSDITVEFTIRLGTRRPRADLVIFYSGESHVVDNAYIIVECKSANTKPSDRSDGVGQLQSYMRACPRALYGMWTNGQERYCYKKTISTTKSEINEVPDIPAFGQSEEDTDRPRFDQLKPASSDALLFAFRRCHNYIAGNQGLQKPEAFWELLKLIFCKIQDERISPEVQFYVSASERQGLNGQLKVRKRIDELFRQVKGDYPQIFKPGDEVELNQRPHLEVSDVTTVPVPRLDRPVEDEIADRIEEAARLRAEADSLEDMTTREAHESLERFMHGQD